MQQSRCLLLAGHSCQACMVDYTQTVLGTATLPRPPRQALHSIPTPAATLLRSHRVAPATCPTIGCGTATQTTPRSEGLKQGVGRQNRGRCGHCKASRWDACTSRGTATGSQAHGRLAGKLNRHLVVHKIGGCDESMALSQLTCCACMMMSQGCCGGATGSCTGSHG